MLNDVPLDIINIIISYIYNPKLALSNITNNMQSQTKVRAQPDIKTNGNTDF